MARPAGRLTPFARIAGEGILLAGGGRALLLQLADPAIAAGVAAHSGFALDPVRRLTGTLEYLYVLAFGTPGQVREAAARVGRAHGPVHGEGYDARDPQLQLWVAATLYETTALLAAILHGPLPPDAADELYREGARIGTALGMPAELWPADRAAFRRWWRARLAELRVGPDARRLARQLMRPAAAPPWLRALLPLTRVVTAGLLPAAIRAQYGVRWDERIARRFQVRFGVLLGIYRVLPSPVRRLPSRIVLRRVRRRSRT